MVFIAESEAIPSVEEYSCVRDEAVVSGGLGPRVGLPMVCGGGIRFSSRSGGRVVSAVSGAGYNSPVRSESELRGAGSCSVALGSNGADRIEPSTRQKVIVSSKVRLQVGQLFMWLSRV